MIEELCYQPLSFSLCSKVTAYFWECQVSVYGVYRRFRQA